MASYTSPSQSGYNSLPPSDDGTESTANRVDWSTIKTKLTDPNKNYADAINSATGTAINAVLDGTYNYIASTGSSGAYVLTYSPAITALGSGGLRISFKANHTNTGAVTVNINGLGTKAITTSLIEALVGGEIQANSVYTLIYDGTQFQLQSPVYESGTWTPTLTPSTNTMTTANTSGFYYRVGRMVVVTGNIDITTIDSGAGAITLGGLPFDVDTSTTAADTYHLYIRLSDTTTKQIDHIQLTGATKTGFLAFSSSTGTGAALVSDIADGASFWFNGTYIID